MSHASETPRSTSDSHPSSPGPSDCLGNGCGDFGFIEDLSTLIALKILVDDLDFDAHPADTGCITVLVDPHLNPAEDEHHKPDAEHRESRTPAA